MISCEPSQKWSLYVHVSSKHTEKKCNHYVLLDQITQPLTHWHYRSYVRKLKEYGFPGEQNSTIVLYFYRQLMAFEILVKVFTLENSFVSLTSLCSYFNISDM